MKKIKLLLLFMLSVCAVGAAAQTEQQEQEPEVRDITLRISNKRGKAVRGVVVQALMTGEVGITDDSGAYVFKNLNENDELRMFLPVYGEAVIPVEGLDSLHVVLRSSSRVTYYSGNGEELNIGYGTTSRYGNTKPVSQLDVERIVAQGGVRNLPELLRGRVAGLDIRTDGSAQIRGASSINLSTEPLVVLDGMEIGTLRDADAVVSVYDIKSVSVLKEGSIYGSKGANGVILITTKK